MRVIVWIEELHWRQCVDQARLLPGDAEITLLHVAPSDVEALAGGGVAGLLGRRRPAPEPAGSYRVIADEEAQALLQDALARLGRTAQLESRRGRVEREVVAACAHADMLIVARDGERRLGPPSLGKHARFVVDHAPCAVLLIWPGTPPRLETMPPPPPHERH